MARNGTPARMKDDDQRSTCMAMMAAGTSVIAIERATGVPRRTIYRWRSATLNGAPVPPSAMVAAAVEDVTVARAEVLSTMADGQRKLAAAISIAVDVLIDQVNDKDLDARDRRAAACEVLDRAGLVTEQRHAVTVAAPMDRAEVLARVEARVAARQITARNSDPTAK